MTPDQQVIKKYLQYDKDSGYFTWLPRDRSEFKSDRVWASWNSRFSGTVAGTKRVKNGKPYLYISINYIQYPAHHLAICFESGVKDNLYVDHIDGNSLNNSYKNLRICTHKENQKNMKLFKNNTSGYCGVSFDKRRGKWNAYISENSKRKSLGYFNEIGDAVLARRHMEKKLKYHNNHGA